MANVNISTGLGLPTRFATEESGGVHTLLVKNSGSVVPNDVLENLVSGVTASIINTTATQVIAAQGAGVSIYVTSIMVTNSSATKTFVNLTDGSGGNTKWTGNAPEDGGFAVSLPVPLKFSANTAIYAECEDTGASVRVCIAGYKE